MQLGVAALACFAAGGLYGWSALIPALHEAYATNTAQAGMVFSLAIVCFTVAIALTPRVLAGLPALRVIAAGAAGGALMLGAASAAASFELFLLTYSLGFGVASGVIYILAVAMAASSKRPQLATAGLVAAFGLGGAVLGPIFRLLSATGLDVLLYLAVPMLIIAALAWWVGKPRHTAPIVPPRTLTITAANYRPLSKIWLIFGLGSMAGLMIIGLATSIVETRGGSVALSSVALSTIAIGNTAGRLSVGILASWLRATRGITGAMLITLAGLILAGLVTTPALSACALTLVALGYGLLASSIPVVTQQVFGARHFHAAFALIFSAWGMAGLTSPWLAGALFDYWGNYLPAIMFATLTTLAALMLSWRMNFDPPHNAQIAAPKN